MAGLMPFYGGMVVVYFFPFCCETSRFPFLNRILNTSWVVPPADIQAFPQGFCLRFRSHRRNKDEMSNPTPQNGNCKWLALKKST